MARLLGSFPLKLLTVTFYSCHDIKMFHQMWEGRSFASVETVVLIAKAPGVWPVGSQTQAVSPDNHQMHLGLAFYDSFFKANIERKVHYCIKM